MKLANQLLASLLLILLPSGIYAQDVDTIEIDGKEYFVYPFEANFEESYYYWNARVQPKYKKHKYTYEEYLFEVSDEVPDSMIVTRAEFKDLQKIIKTRSYKKMKRFHIEKFGPLPTKEEFKQYLSYRRKRIFKRKGEGYGEYKYLTSRKFKKAMRANPYPLFLQSYRIESDVIPVLDSLPDGDYVQLYESYCFADKKGKCDYIEGQVAGYFSIKNNLLHGEATWIGAKGDTLKQGLFQNGLKEGIWKLTEYQMRNLDEEQVKLYIETGSPTIDIRREVIEFKNGSRNGLYQYFESASSPLKEGHYIDNAEAGEWIYRLGYFSYEYDLVNDKSLDLNVVINKYTLNNDEALVVKPIWMRDGSIGIWRFDDEFDFASEYGLEELPDDLYEPAFERELDLDLEEEKDDIRDIDYDFEYSYDYDGYDDFGGEDFSHHQPVLLDEDMEKYRKRGVVFDSIGAYPKYVSNFERYYPNGQLAYKYEFVNGLLKEEPLIYWDNGVVHDEIVFVADSNHYLRNIYDYKGKLYKSFVYDLLGDFVESLEEEDEMKYVILDGLEIPDYEYGNIWYYNIADSTYDDPMTEKVLHNRSWCKIDTSVLWEGFYDPIERVRSIESFGVDGSVNYRFNGQFSEGFESWTGKTQHYLGDIELETIKSASLLEWREMDSIPQGMVGDMFNAYDITDDCTLLQNGELYSGDLKIDLTAKKLAIKKGVVIDIAAYKVDEDKLEKNFWKYKKKGKSNNLLELSQVNASDFAQGSANEVFRNMFYPLFSEFFSFSGYGDYYWEDEYDYYEEERSHRVKRTPKKDQLPRLEKIEGAMLDGKPMGEWTAYDQFGNTMISVPFEKGLANGAVRYYDHITPENEANYYYEPSFNDTFPDKKTFYMNKVEEYVNGKMDGVQTEYNWIGEIVSESHYKEGFPHGQSMERNNLATSISQYRNGALDGYMRAYLTLPGKDSLLLYDLLFQNGMLQGESKSYHTNGNISKRGFFLTGDPIDDYEGYDSLGFRYHYVKFDFSYPVEEKIWEENELSVRYLFDWQDSIEFSPIDITSSESLDILLEEHGFGRGYYDEPYYGRPSLINKAGIDYRLTKYYPNDTIARDGTISNGRKSGNWEYFSYEGEKLHQINYFDSLIVLNDSIMYNSKGIYTEVDAKGDTLYKSYIIEKFERYDCSHTDHYETRQLKTIWEASDTLHRMNGDVLNFYDNGTLQSAGKMKNGLPDGEWRFYDPNGKLNKYGYYVLGKRDGRWLSGDLSKTKYLGEICLNPNMPDLEEEIKYRENLLDIEIIYYKLGKSLHTEYYDVNMNFRDDYYDDESEDEVDDSEESDDQDDDQN